MKSTIYFWVGSLANSAQPIILLPISTIMFSQVEVSIWLMFSVVSSFILVTESGLTIAIVRAASYYKAGRTELSHTSSQEDSTFGERNDAGLTALRKQSTLVYLVMGAIILGVIGMLGGLSLKNLITISSDPKSNWLSFTLLLLALFVQAQSMRCSALLQGIGELLEAKKIQAAFALIKLAAGFLFIYFGYGLVGFTFSQLITCILEFMFLSNRMKEFYSDFAISEESAAKSSRQVLAEIWQPIWKSSIVRVSGFFIFYGSSLIVAQLNDVQLISSFLLSQRLFLLCVSFAMAPFMVQVPQITALVAKHNVCELKNVAVRSITICLLLYLLGCLLIIFAVPLVLIFIADGVELLRPKLLIYLSIVYFLELHHIMHATAYESSNDHPFIPLSLVSSIVLLGGYVFALEPWGVAGLITVHFLVQASGNNWVPVKYFLKLMGMTFFEYIMGIISSLKSVFLWKSITQRPSGQ